MLLRDEMGDDITEENWHKIDLLFTEAWQSFSRAVERIKQ